MRVEEGYFKSFDQTELYFRVWIRASKLSVLLIHGYGDHSSRYQDLVNELSDLPISWFAYDLRGQGKSKGERVYADSFEAFQKDTQEFLNFCKTRYSDRFKSVVLLGHSFGGLIAARFAEQSSEKFIGLVLTSPCFRTAGVSDWKVTKRLSAALSLMAPHLVLNNFVRPRYLFKNPEKMTDYMNDALIERRITSRLSYVLLRTCWDSERWNARFDQPVLILASGNDKIVSLAATVRWFDRAKAPSKEIRIYPNLYHEIFNELDHQEPLDDLKGFLIKLLEV